MPETWPEQRKRLEEMAVELADCQLSMVTGELCVCTEKAAAIKEALRRLDACALFAALHGVADFPPDLASHSDVEIGGEPV